MTGAKAGRMVALLVSALAAVSLAGAAQAADAERHGASLFGDLKYGRDFKHFDYVNPKAPKGGALRYAAIGTFDSLNAFIVKGEQGAGLALVYDTLLEPSLDEPGAEYGLIAESLSYPDDFSSVTFSLRKQARFNDGKPVTAQDVIWSFETLKKLNPFYAAYYHNVTKAEAIAPGKVRFSFSMKGNRELPQIVGQLPVLPKHYWLARNDKGKTRDISQTTLDAPLGSGPYRIAKIIPGRTIIYARVKDYWAKDLPAKIGTSNFDTMRFDYYGDPTIAFEAFKGDQVDYRGENSAKNWATGYDIPPVKDGRIEREQLRTQTGAGMQSFAFNLRRAMFNDARVREAFNWAFDFEWQNKTLFYGQYTRTGSYFENTELASRGVPSGAELDMLKPFAKDLPPALFTSAYTNPKTDGSGNNRANLRKAGELLDAAGWKIVNGTRADAKGKGLAVEFLLADPMFERVVAPYKQSLERLGIKVSLRTVDAAQYQNRVDNRDFDIIVQSFGQSLSPGNEQRDFWGCEAAKAAGSRNVIGICDPAVEKLVDRVIFARSRAELLAATHALDRVLLWRHYVVPQWYSPYRPRRLLGAARASHTDARLFHRLSRHLVVRRQRQGREESARETMTQETRFARRTILGLMGASAASALLRPLRAEAGALDAGPRHGMSIFGELKYPKGFAHFDYVNPAAPKGGTLSEMPSTGAYNASLLTFDTLNGYILKGNAPARLDLIFDTLMARAYDEPDAVYGLVAESVETMEKGDRLIFRLREAARFHDGTTLTAEDAAFSFMLLKEKGHPLISLNLREMKKAEALDKHTLAVTFTGKQTRDLAIFVASTLPIFSKAYYTSHGFEATTLEPPLGSGPYKIGAFKAGDNIVYRARGGLLGARSQRQCRVSGTSSASASSSTATARRASRPSAPGIIFSARNSPRRSGRRSTIFPPSRTGASSG